MSLPVTEISGVEATRDPRQCSVKPGTPTAGSAQADSLWAGGLSAEVMGRLGRHEVLRGQVLAPHQRAKRQVVPGSDLGVGQAELYTLRCKSAHMKTHHPFFELERGLA